MSAPALAAAEAEALPERLSVSDFPPDVIARVYSAVAQLAANPNPNPPPTILILEKDPAAGLYAKYKASERLMKAERAVHSILQSDFPSASAIVSVEKAMGRDAVSPYLISVTMSAPRDVSEAIEIENAFYTAMDNPVLRELSRTVSVVLRFSGQPSAV